MTHEQPNRRDLLKAGSAAMAVAFAQMSMPNFVFAADDDDDELVPFLNMPRSTRKSLDWETLTEWITPQDQVFDVSHHNVPKVDGKGYKLDVTGLVEKPRTFTLEELRALPKKDQLMTLECSGNGVNKGFMNAIYNSKWTGTPVAEFLRAIGIKDGAKEVVFIGEDAGVDKQLEAIGKVTPAPTVNFGRSMSIADAMAPQNLLAYERNGKPLEVRNGFPLRLIVPGWYGICNVKWIKRIEIRDTRYMGRFMARDYVTIREEKRGDETSLVSTSVTKMNLKSVIARVMRKETTGGQVPVKAYGAVWSGGTAPKTVQVKVDSGKWQDAVLAKEPRSKYCWTFFSIDLGKIKPGKHTLVSRGIDVNGRVQPSKDDEEIALKKTYYESYAQWPREIELEA